MSFIDRIRDFFIPPPAEKAAPARVTAKAAEKPKPRRPPAKKSTTRKGKTRAELYEQATELKIPGRTKMTKAELQRAIAAKKRK
jgi:hypothetical protein